MTRWFLSKRTPISNRIDFTSPFFRFAIGGTQFTIRLTPVSEPSTGRLVFAGLIGLVTYERRSA